MRSLLSRLTCGLLTLAALGCKDSHEPAPDSPPEDPAGKIVFETSFTGRPETVYVSPDIYVVNADGSALTRLTYHADEDFSPSWSGDGRQIYFLSYNRDGRPYPSLYAMNPDGSDVHLVVDLPPYVLGAYDVSPDGARIALGAPGPPEEPSQDDLFLMNADGSGLTRLVDLPTACCDGNFFDCEDIEAVAWSPDGQRIAYSTRQTGRGASIYSHIGVVNADGTGHQLLTEGGWSGSPAWAPDGQRIAFSSSKGPIGIGQPQDLEIINADGTDRTVVLDGHVDGMVYAFPSWSPGGQSFVFSRFPTTQDSDSSELYTVRIDGTGLRRVPGLPGALRPDWSPAAP